MGKASLEAEACIPAAQEAETARWKIQGQPAQHTEFKVRLGSLVQLYLKTFKSKTRAWE